MKSRENVMGRKEGKQKEKCNDDLAMGPSLVHFIPSKLTIAFLALTASIRNVSII